MPPRSSLTSSFSVSDATNEVVCPLKNHDGSACRKRCLGEKRYRSMQEHIRRAHPGHYIAKLPATEESFALMVNTPPTERPPPPPNSNPPLGGPSFYHDEYNFEGGPSRSSDEFRRGSLLPATNAAEVLAQLHTQRPEIHWDADPELFSDNETFSNRPRARFAPQNIEPRFGEDYYPDFGSSHRELLPSSLARSPPYARSSTLPPAPRVSKPSRPRKNSVGQNARRPRHERTKSKDHTKRMSFDRKAMSAEPSSLSAKYGNRWEDLIEAAASATEEDTRDLTPIPPSPRFQHRNSLPPLLAAHHHFQSNNNTYNASPLQRALTPPPPDMSDLQPFPSVESSTDSKSTQQSGLSGLNFHMSSGGLSDSSPSFAHPVQIYCAGCRRLSILKESFACSECICGLCKDCVDALSTEQLRGRLARCPRCSAIGGKFKPFQLDIR
ncbi:hypothetical protein EJ08DRAFT_720684 [Tothia fuscella]|uniref:RING zinc finger-like domain-containing protein n=1 Tax=Tothia fuscella TaxID=1048955 RepID=A0A9P4NLZ6_9PEZI|nr:hypothetical protein EJ08DRAFT_720684 [Tothia fuscella]